MAFINLDSQYIASISEQAARARKMTAAEVIQQTEKAAQAYAQRIKTIWPALHAKILENQSGGEWACQEMNSALPSIMPLYISIAVSQLNASDIHPADTGRIPGGQCIEIYISCVTQYVNVLAMEMLYSALQRAKLETAVYIYKYRPFNPAVEIVAELSGTSDLSSIKYTDLAVAYEMGLNELKKPIFNLIIQAPADKLEKKVIRFAGGKSDGDRILSWCTFDIARLLISVIGEHALVNMVGYIEFVTLDGIPSNTKFYELISIRDAVAQCDGISRIKLCHGCDRHPLCGEQKQCGRCHAVRYCSVVCQSIDWPNHKKYCKAN